MRNKRGERIKNGGTINKNETMEPDTYYIHRCEIIGKAAAKKGNSAVGAIIVKDDVIISQAEEAGKSKNDITCHAEIEAIRTALRKLTTSDLSGCILYTTHEPCIMCSYAIRFYKIKKVVFQKCSGLSRWSYFFNALAGFRRCTSALVRPSRDSAYAI